MPDQKVRVWKREHLPWQKSSGLL